MKEISVNDVKKVIGAGTCYGWDTGSACIGIYVRSPGER